MEIIGNNYDVTGKPEKEGFLNLCGVGMQVVLYGDQFLSIIIIVSYC